MSNVVYPSNFRGLAFTVTKTAKFNTIVSTSPAFVESRVVQSQNPNWSWTLRYDVLGNNSRSIAYGESYADLQRLQGFYLARQGRFDSFLFDDPDDDFVGPAMLSAGVPNLQAQLQVVTDGTMYYSPLQRNMGGQFYEDVTDINGGVIVFDNSVLKVNGVDYNIFGPGLAFPGYSSAGMYLKWVSPPTGPVTAQFLFFFRVRFDSDTQDFEKFVQSLFTIGGSEAQDSNSIKLVSARITSL